jgi:hypothetical protein
VALINTQSSIIYNGGLEILSNGKDCAIIIGENVLIVKDMTWTKVDYDIEQEIFEHHSGFGMSHRSDKIVVDIKHRIGVHFSSRNVTMSLIQDADLSQFRPSDLSISELFDLINHKLNEREEHHA